MTLADASHLSLSLPPPNLLQVPGPDGEPYYVNYARGQSAWRVPPGWTGAVKPGSVAIPIEL